MSENIKIEFENLHIPISEIVKSYTYKQQEEILNYLKSLDEYDKKAYLIAFNHIGSSYNIYKSNGFKEFLKKNEK